ncbi:LysR family transcriptional regulator [Thaumasiovibrio subtropicus]|uniref:LysR family transcriptional regulator n=1 Tax=Thaumasiovibrio subtropicus TaxID=1891207 RepID=UPI000B35C01F|nr:LysR family transcriptional regulator [Thaumasiovibrio subtropicus]
MLDDIALLITAAEAGSLKKTAQTLKLPSSTLSRRIQHLEDNIGCRLLNRNSHHFSLTAEGEMLVNQTRYHLLTAQSAIEQLKQDVKSLTGDITVLAPVNLTTTVLSPIFAQFSLRHPDINLNLQLSNELESFHAANADFAIRVGRQEDSDLTQVRLGQVAVHLVASPKYLNGRNPITTPQDLSLHALIQCKPIDKWHLKHATKKETTFFPQHAKVRLNDLMAAKQFLVAGVGIGLMPESEIRQELARGELVAVLPEWQADRRDIYAVWYKRRFLSHRAAALIDYLKENADQIAQAVTGQA